MSAETDWKRVFDASDEIHDLAMDIPGGDYGFTHTAKTSSELHQIALLLEAALPLLQRVLDREEPRYSEHMERHEARRAAH
jgi:hypothetical protein